MTDIQQLPNDNELEGVVLGALLLESEALNTVIGIINTPNIFYSKRNRLIWEAIIQLNAEGEPIDTVTVLNVLKSRHKSKMKEISLYLVELSKLIGSAANIESHAILLKEIYIRRRLIEISRQYNSGGYDLQNDVFELYDNLLGELNTLNGEINRQSFKTYAEIIQDKTEQLKNAANTHTYITGLPTGLSDLDRVLSGLQNTDLIIIAARPAMGKTAFVVDMARKQAANSNAPVAFFSLEMSAPQLTERSIAAETLIPLNTIKRGGLTREQWQKYDIATDRMKQYPLYISDSGGMTLNEICSISKNWKLKYGIRAIYIDYLQLINNTGAKKNSNREQEISGISRRLKQLAKELSLPVIALSQLSRSVEARADKRPMISDLRESGAIEQDADIIMFLYREEYYNQDNQSENEGLTEIIIGKHRNGETGMVSAYFNKECQTFTNYNKDDTPF
jgi:replicative DNA helicase